jgi:hypothetical protein
MPVTTLVNALFASLVGEDALMNTAFCNVIDNPLFFVTMRARPRE